MKVPVLAFGVRTVLQWMCKQSRLAGRTYPRLVHRPASVFEARGPVHKAWISPVLTPSDCPDQKGTF